MRHLLYLIEMEVPHLRRSAHTPYCSPASRPGLRTAGPSGLIKMIRCPVPIEYKMRVITRTSRRFGSQGVGIAPTYTLKGTAERSRQRVCEWCECASALSFVLSAEGKWIRLRSIRSNVGFPSRSFRI